MCALDIIARGHEDLCTVDWGDNLKLERVSAVVLSGIRRELNGVKSCWTRSL